MSPLPLDVGRDRRGTDQRSQRFKPCNRFWSQGSHTSRQGKKAQPADLFLFLLKRKT